MTGEQAAALRQLLADRWTSGVRRVTASDVVEATGWTAARARAELVDRVQESQLRPRLVAFCPGCGVPNYLPGGEASDREFECESCFEDSFVPTYDIEVEYVLLEEPEPGTEGDGPTSPSSKPSSRSMETTIATPPSLESSKRSSTRPSTEDWRPWRTRSPSPRGEGGEQQSGRSSTTRRSPASSVHSCS